LEENEEIRNMEDIDLNDDDEDLNFGLWKTELNKELRFFWESMIG
jgi:hypothetical protein